jgi:hypothetical protein
MSGVCVYMLLLFFDVPTLLLTSSSLCHIGTKLLQVGIVMFMDFLTSIRALLYQPPPFTQVFKNTTFTQHCNIANSVCLRRVSNISEKNYICTEFDNLEKYQ